MYKMLTVFVSLNLMVLSASNEGLVKKEITSEIKLSETKSVSKIEAKQKSRYDRKTNARELKPISLKKIKNNIDLIDSKRDELDNAVANSKSIYLQKIEMGHGVPGVTRKPSFVQGPRASISGGQISRNSRDNETLFFSEYGEGSSYNKWLEIYNGTGSDVDMSSYAIGICNNGHGGFGGNDFDPATDPHYEVLTPLSGTLVDGDVYFVTRYAEDENGDPLGGNYADPALGALMDFNSGTSSGTPCSFNGNDWLGLYKLNADGTETLLDVLGPSPISSGTPSYDSFVCAGESDAFRNHTLIRKSSVMTGNTDWASSAGTDTETSEWTIHPSNYWDDAGMHTMVDPDAPYLSEGFEGDVFPPAGWDMVSPGGSDWLQGDGTSYGPGAPNSGSYAAYFDVWNYTYNETSTLISPPIDLSTANAPELSFYYWDSYHSPYYPNSLDVQISTDGGVSFTSLLALNSSLGWEEFKISLASYVGSTVHVAFNSVSDWGSNNPHIDDITVAELPLVPSTVLSTSSIDFGNIYFGGGSSSLDFTVTNSGGADLVGTVSSDNSKFTVSAMPATLAPGEVTSLTVTYTPTAEGADQGSITISHNGDPSTDVVSVTGMGSPNVLEQNFDGLWTGSPAAPAGWQVIDSDADGTTWRQGNAYIPEVDLFAAYGSGNNDDWLISPVISLSGHQLLKWKDVVESANYPNVFDVYVFPGGVVDVSAAINLGTFTCTNTVLTEQSVDLLTYDGTDVRVAFHQTSSLSAFWGFGIDDVSVEAAPAVPILGDIPTNLLFPATVVGETRSISVSLANVGVGELSGTIAYSDGFTGPATFTTETSVDIAVSYAPTTGGTHSGTVTITSNGGDAVMAVGGNAGGSVATWDDDLDGDGYDDWPTGWEVVNADLGSNEWDFFGTGSYARTGTGSAGVAYEGYATANDDWLISPQLDVVAGDKFIFHAAGLSTFYTETFNVMLSTTGAVDVSSFDVTLLSSSVASASGDYSTFEIDLSAYVGTQPRIAIQYTAANQYYLFVDDVSAPAVYQSAGPTIYDYFTSVDFGTVTAGETGSFLWDYYNIGGSDLEITAVTFSDATFSLSSTSTLPIVTTSGGIGSFDVVFSPPAGVDSDYSGTMTVTHNSGEDIVVLLSGYGLYATYVESFNPNANGDYEFPSGWENREDGGGSSWFVDGSYGLRHGYNSTIADNDTALSVAIDLPVVDGYHYELEFSEYNAFGSYAEYCGISITTDGGQTFTPIFESAYVNGVFSSLIDLTGYSGTVHLAFVYIGTDGNNWGVDDLIIRSKEDPVIPILTTSALIFPPTPVGSSSVEKLYFSNIGAGNYEGSVTYPSGVTGTASITGLAPGVMDSMEVTYTPTVQGILTGDVVFDGSASGAASLTVTPEGNSGVQGATFEDSWIGWDDYSLDGYPSASGTPDTWLWFGGNGHSGPNFAGVYSYAGNWGGVNDFLVSPKLEVESGDVLSFWAQGGYGIDCDYGETLGINTDSLVVWISTEMPIMGMDEDGVDTGFVNTDAFTAIGGGEPSCDTWDAYSYDLSSYAGDAWVLIQSVKEGWLLRIDDVAYPGMYMNPNPVLYVGKEYDFGVTQPTGDSVRYYLRNTGGQDLVIDNMDFENGEYFDVAYGGTFPITITPGGIDSIDVYWMPEMEGIQRDTLVYTSNYTVGDVDAFGRGTDRSVFIADAFNNPPNPTALIGPNDETVLVIDDSNADGSTQIIWMNATDPDGYPISYLLELVFENTTDTLDTVLTTNVFSLSHAEALDYMEDNGVTSLNVIWDVYTDDSFDMVPSSNGPWSLTIDGGSALSVDNNTLPEVFALHNNYPNPFNPVTNIGYDIPELSNVSIDIYNIAGNKVKTLVSKEHQPGRYKIQWNATNELGAPVATGMYIYKIRANDFVSVKKLLLMK